MTGREAILQASATVLATVSGATFYRSREAAIARAEGTAIVLRPEDEQIEKRAADLTLRNLVMVISILARGQIPDQVADPVAQAIHSVLMADPTLNGLCAQLIEHSTKWLFAEADLTATEVEIRYTARYQTRARDLSQTV